jgi:hexokinase
VLPLGFTFSFPMTQQSIDCALLNTWTKSYDIPEVVNRNPTEFLQNAIDALVRVQTSPSMPFAQF